MLTLLSSIHGAVPPGLCDEEQPCPIAGRFARSTREEWFKRLSRLPAPTVEALMDVYHYQEEYGCGSLLRDASACSFIHRPSTAHMQMQAALKSLWRGLQPLLAWASHDAACGSHPPLSLEHSRHAHSSIMVLES